MKTLKPVLAAMLVATLTCVTPGTSFAETNVQKATAQAPENQTLTVYTNGAVIQETRKVDLNGGPNAIQLTGVSGQYRPQTLLLVSAKGPGDFVLDSVSYQGANLNTAQLLASAVGKEVTVSSGNGAAASVVTGTLVSVCEGELIVIPTDSASARPRIIKTYDQVSIPEIPTGLSTTPSLTLQASALVTGNSKPAPYVLKILYQSAGFTWGASHSLVYDEKTGQLTSFESSASVSNNSGTDYKGVSVKLLAGYLPDANAPRAYAADAAPMAAMAPGGGGAARFGGAAVESVGEQKLYSVPGSVDIKQGENKQIRLQVSEKVPVESEFYFNVNGDTGNANQPVNLRIHSVNDKAHNLGQPLPAGLVRIYQNDSTGNLQLTAPSSLQSIAVGEKFAVEIGRSSDVKAQVKYVGGTVDPKSQDPNSTQARFQTQSFQVTLFNAKDRDVSVNVIQQTGDGSSVEHTTHPFAQDGGYNSTASVKVPKNGSTVVKYTVRTRISE